MPKFFLDADRFGGSHIELGGEMAHHIVNVLRYRIGDEVHFCDGNCTDYVARLISSEASRKSTKVRFEILEATSCQAEPSIFVRLFQSVIKWESLDFAIQKSVEVGVSEIVPTVTNRSIYKISDVKKKIERMRRIAKSAAEQSRRGIVPKVAEPICFYDSLTKKNSVAFFACCDEEKSLASRFEKIDPKKADLWIGPEGGFTEQEKKSLLHSDVKPYSLGPRVLRSETAAIVSISNLLMLSQR